MNNSDNLDDISKMNDSAGKSKVASLIQKYNISGIGAEMEDLWTANGDERLSLRELERYFNKQLLMAVLENADTMPIDGDIGYTYDILIDNDGTEGERTRLRHRLEQKEIDVDQLISDFVSYQSIRTYLTEDRNAEYNREIPPADTATITQQIRRLIGRTSSVTTEKVERLRDRDVINIGSIHVFVDVYVMCEDCGSRYEVSELLQSGGCDCPSEN